MAGPDHTAGCHLCPRNCGLPRTAERPGACGACDGSPETGQVRVARLMVHHWEEPFISGTQGSGAIFFSGCNLRCCFCQNSPISHENQGTLLDRAALTRHVLRLHATGVHSLNLVTPSHLADRLPSWLAALRLEPAWRSRPLPVVWNSGGYETVESLRPLEGLVQIYLPDLKYHDPGLSDELAGADDYFTFAAKAVMEMHRQQPEPVWNREGILLSGLVVRHLVLPGYWRDSCRIIDFLASRLPLNTPISIMNQYTPQIKITAIAQPVVQKPQQSIKHPELDRHLTTFEYRKVIDHALDCGFSQILGQERSAAGKIYTPEFSERFRPGLT